MNSLINVVLNNKKTITVSPNTTIREIVLNNSDVCEYKVVGAKIQNEIVDFDYVLNKDCHITLIDLEDIDGYKMTQAGLKFVLEVALKNNFGPGVEVNYNHSIGNGINTTISGIDNFTKEDVDKLKKCMDQIIDNDLKFIRYNVLSKEAISYYQNHKEFEKADNIHNIYSDIVTIYKLDNYYNYYFNSMPESTGYLNDFELVYIDDKELALVLPTNHTFNLVEYKNYRGITKCFKDTFNILDKYNMSYVSDINKSIAKGNSKDIIKLCETYFNIQLTNCANKIIEKKAKFVLIAGPSSSGKTTTAKKLLTTLKAMGKDVLLISTDDYFLNLEDTPKKEDGKYDFESIKAVDVNALNNDLRDLVNEKEVILPSYNFKTGKREYLEDKVKLGKDAIILIEGIHSLNDDLTPYIDKDDKYKVYLSPFMGVKIDRHNYLSTTDLRLIRRIIRDNNNRAMDVAKTISMWDSVRQGEEENIFPFLDEADIIINTSLPYELGVLRVFAIPLLYSVDNSSPYLEEARRLIRYLEYSYPISSEYVNDDSIIREFIGGSIFRKEGDV